ncbi:MAG TPA: GWxTD domain-containing protein [Candidatus Acidoferrales bacterium]|jgi:GWxTD domain-containing protein|nr:GWxTD domain-containing protein [Candidatus Acidoferrales bacterium]
MNTLAHWVEAPIAKALGWTLIHFVWEGVLIAALLAAVLALRGTASARFRYVLACVAMLAMPAAFGVTLARLWQSPAGVARAPGNARRPGGAVLSLSQAPAVPAQPAMASLAKPGPESPVAWVVPFWMLGVFAFHVRMLGGWVAAQRLRRVGVCRAPDAWQRRFQGLGERLCLTRPVALLESCLGEVPVVIGLLRPVVLVPVGMLAGLPVEQVEWILIHELAHIRRHDYLVNLLQSFIEGLLFYHPSVWWVSEVIRAERENCCDDVVVAVNGDARGYAAALAALEAHRGPVPEPALAATGGSLMRRIRRLLQQPEGPRAEGLRATLAPLFMAGILLVSVVAALSAWQTKPVPASGAARPAAAPATLETPRQAAPQAAQQETEPAAGDAQNSDDQTGDQSSSTATQSGNGTKQAPEKLKLLAQQIAQPRSFQPEIETPYRKWLNEDVAYIITDEERAAFKRLTTDPELERFIEQFWLRRDPTPGTAENEFKEEHYRRIAYANDHFASNDLPGWKTDRGRIYISYGPPDEKDSHPAGGTYQRPTEQGGGTTSVFPFEQWRYRYIKGMGNDVTIEFVDSTMSGEYRMTMDPSDKDALPYVRGAAPAVATTDKLFHVGVSRTTGMATITVPLFAVSGQRPLNIYGTITTLGGRIVTRFEETSYEESGLQDAVFQKSFPLAAGSYSIEVTVSANGVAPMIWNKAFEVK